MVNESDAIQRVLDGDRESFRLLVRRYEGPVIRVIRNMACDGESVEDLAQEVFLTAYAKLATFDPARSAFSTWLFTIARNKSINALKKKRPQARSRLPVQIDSTQPSKDSERNELFARLDRALESLPPRQRRAFVLAEFEALSYAEIARIEATRIGTVKSRISRAKQKLAHALRQYGIEEK